MTITVQTEDGRRRSGPAEPELRMLVARIGGQGDRFLVADRLPAVPQVYAQVWHEGAGPYVVEFREGSADRHFRAEVSDPERVAAVLLDWSRDGERWRAELGWQQYEVEPPPPQLSAETREEAENFARRLVHGGFGTCEEIVRGVTEYFDAEHEVHPAQARGIVNRLWRERLAEQAEWPETTDADRLLEVFGALDANGIVARPDFACCRRCGMTEIGAEAGEGDRGFVFFHEQDTNRAVEGAGMWLAYGTLAGSTLDPAAVGREVVAALRAAGLPVEWNGSADARIHVTPLDWRKRLPVD